MAPLNLSVAAVLVALTLLSYVAAKEDVVAVQRNVTMASSTERAATVSDGSTRTGRIMQIFKNDHRRLAGPARHVHTPPVMRARADRFPLNPQRLPIAYQRRPAAAMRPQILRRIQNNLPKGPPLRFPNQMPRYEVVKSSRYSPAKNGGSPNGIKNGGAYRPQLQFGGGKTVAGGGGHQHPNALVSGSPLQQNFKASPNFNGHVKIRPVMVAQQQKQQLQQKQPHQQQQALNQREQFATPNYQSQPHPYSSQQQQQQQQLQQQQHHFSFPQQLTSQQEPLPQSKSKVKPINFESPSAGDTSASLFNKATAPSGYAVYEDPEHQLQTAEDYNVRVTDQKSLREVQEYLKFMGSNVYFLPKRDPNYRDIDVERDHLQYHQQQPQQQPQPQQQQQHYSQPMYDSAAAATAYQQFYQTPKVPSAPHNFFDEVPPSAASSATVVRSSYQAGQNEFVVSSDGQKGMKRIMPAPLTPSSTNAPAAYHAFQFSSARNRTPEPVRFEFTERDAISPTTYTHSPITGQLRKSSSQEVRAVDRNYLASSSPRTPASGSATTRRTTSSPNYDAAIKQPVGENLDDPEDDDDMLDTDSDTYGRIPIYPSIAATSQEPPAEQKDTEDYCERICSNVQDDDEEIVCGSDGFMYTSEAQMECYASCLHIDVTIQSKGCNSR